MGALVLQPYIDLEVKNALLTNLQDCIEVMLRLLRDLTKISIIFRPNRELWMCSDKIKSF